MEQLEQLKPIAENVAKVTVETVTQMVENPNAPVVLGFAVIVLVIIALMRVNKSAERSEESAEKIAQLDKSLTDRMKSLENQTGEQGTRSREEVTTNLRGMGDSVTKVMGEMARTQQSQLDSFAGQLRDTSRGGEQRMGELQKSIDQRLLAYQDRMDRVGDVLDDKLGQNDQRIEALRQSLEMRMDGIQRENSMKLQQIEQIVDDRLNSTLDRRLSESFRLVNERLERVYQGLDDMQALTSGMGDLKRVLTSVRTRGMVGEVQLGALLAQLMTPEQYQVNARIKPGPDTVDFAIVLPGRTGTDRSSLLPIGANFPSEIYDKLMDALDGGDQQLVEQLSDQLATGVRNAAAHLADQFIYTPLTTDFAVLFLGSEGLYAEVVRKPGLIESIQQEFHVMIAGPTTLSAMLNSLQMGMRTIALERRSEEVWALLGAVQGEISTFAEALARTQKRIRQASESIEDAAQKSRLIQRKLKNVDPLTEAERRRLLKANAADDEEYDNVDWD